MKNFEEIKSQWKNQADIIPPKDGTLNIIKKTNALKKGQQITNIVLGVTVGVLIIFFFYVKAYLEFKAAIALILMISVVLIRIGIEIKSINALKHIKYFEDAHSFRNSLLKYYKNRLRTHYVFTPIILMLYCIGFIMLMPFFKVSLSTGFYNYIQVSGFVLIIIGLFLIYKQIQKELLNIKRLMD